MGGDAEPSKVDVAGMLDNLVAGQQPAELSLYQNVVKEAELTIP